MTRVSGKASRHHGTASAAGMSTLPATATTTGIAPITMSVRGAPAARTPITSRR